MRLDLFLVQKHSFTRNKAQQLISTGLVLVNEKVITKPAFEVGEVDEIHIQEDRRVHWVSRSAEKLAGFLEQRTNNSEQIIIPGTNCLDVGASTGGFTQVLLEYGAAHVDTVDVGTNQLHEIIRNNPKVTSYEQQDIRSFISSYAPYSIIVCDASFISLHEILPSMLGLADEHTDLILLYKPQFEVGRENLRKTGVPKDEKIVEQKMMEFETFLKDQDCQIITKERSTLIGEAGNQEWIYWIKKR